MRVTRTKRAVTVAFGALKRTKVKEEIEGPETVPAGVKEARNGLKTKVDDLVDVKENGLMLKQELVQVMSAEDIKTETLDETCTLSSRVKLEPEGSQVSLEEKSLHLCIKRPLPHIKVETELPNVFSHVLPADAVIGPKGWADIYNEIATMRTKFMAPVDTMGCERMPETITPNIKKTKPRIYRFQLLISLMLSSQTKDEINYDAMVKLQSAYLAKGFADGLCLEAILASTEKEIDSYILKVGFHNRKAVYIKKACELLANEFGGDVPQTIEQVVTLPGVGPKMGFLLLQKGWDINTGIGVDVHLHRLAQMWGWVKKSDKPEVTRLELQNWLPQQYWADINPLLVGFGQTVCPSKLPNCDVCSLAVKGMCRGVDRKRLKEGLTESRLLKLQSQRADLSQLLAELTS